MQGPYCCYLLPTLGRETQHEVRVTKHLATPNGYEGDKICFNEAHIIVDLSFFDLNFRLNRLNTDAYTSLYHIRKK